MRSRVHWLGAAGNPFLRLFKKRWPLPVPVPVPVHVHVPVPLPVLQL